ncbi:MAG: isoprenyl transferase [Symbiobacteriaceae bacterium]|nr:isoprenyl transferase [Symbiobacteriaceae bacterium]
MSISSKPLHHLALIMDGNGRWAERRLLPRTMGHQAGLEAMRRLIRAAPARGIKVLTFFAFSTENWQRPPREVEFLMSLPERFVKQDLPELIENKVKVLHSGVTENIPTATLAAIREACQATVANDRLYVNLAFNYGGQQEIVDAVKAIVQDVQGGILAAEEIRAESISARLYHPELPPPDLIVRASGEQRLSNFLLWQSAYAELLFSPLLWPDFDDQELERICSEYTNRQRRFGGI